jgi:copper transport protein
LRVPWPPVPAAVELRSVLTRLAATRTLTWKESVSSDTARPAPAAVTLHDTGRDFLDSEVYGDGRGLQPVLLPSPNGLRHFAFGVGGAFFIEMTTDREGKLVTEQVVTPNHLIERRFGP